jgi:DNA-binding transcriptional LysR family regulator
MPTHAIYRWEFERRGKAFSVDVTGPLTLDDPTVTLCAVRAGLCLAYLSESFVAKDLAEGRLVRVLKDWMPSFPGLCLYYPGRRHVPAGLRALINLIRELRTSNRLFSPDDDL